MSTRTENQDFLAYRDEGSIEGLARVFDALAPRLLLLAAHVTPDASQAEDLVQATFLDAMRSAQRYDGQRPVAGWLTGILKNRALHLRRRVAVRQSDPLPTGLVAAGDPLQVLHDQELWERVATEIDALPNPYREVLSLRLVHGIEPTAIAHTLGRAPSTVRMQLSRGLDRLREALPKQMAGLAPWVLEPVRGLEGIRSVVLSQAGGTAAAAAATSTSAPVGAGWFAGALMMKAWVWIVIGTLSMIAFWTLRWLDEPISEAALEPKGGGEAALVQSESPPSSSNPSLQPSRVGTVAREQAGPAQVSEPAAESNFEVRVRYAEGGDAIPGVGVYLRPLISQGDGAARLGVDGRTDGQGLAHFADLAEGWYQAHLDRSIDPIPFEYHGQRSVDLLLPRGIDVTGRVVSLDGEAVAGATILRFNEGHHDVMQVLTTADDSGKFQLFDVSEDTELIARSRGWQPSEPETVRVEAHEMELVMGARGQSLRGRVVDEQGRGVPHAWIVVGVDEDARDNLEGSPDVPAEDTAFKAMDLEGILVRADERGDFLCEEVPAGFVLLIAREPGPNGAAVGHSHLWMPQGGTQETSLTLLPGAEVHGVVRDGSGRPVVGVEVEAEWEGSRLLGQLEDDLGPFVSDRRTVTDEHGAYRLRGLVLGDYDLRIRGGRRTLHQTETELTQGQSFRWDPITDEIANLSVELRSAAGEPLVGWFVTLSSTQEAHIDWNFMGRTTDERGRIVVMDLKPDEIYRMRLFGPNRLGRYSSFALAQREGIQGDRESVVIALTEEEESLAEVHGQAWLGSNQTAGGRVLTLRSEDGAGDGHQRIAGDGTFRWSDVPHGRYRILDRREGRVLKVFDLGPGETLDLGSLVLE